MASANDAPHRLQNLRDDALASPHVPQMTSPFCGGRLGLAASTLGGLRGAVAVGFTSPVPAASALVGDVHHPAVAEVAATTTTLLASLVAKAPVRTRESEQEKGRARGAAR